MERYPISAYYQDHVVAGTTIRQTARSWVAVLLIADPKTNLESVRIYQWQRTTNEGEWKRRGVITLDRAEQVREIIGALQNFAHTVAKAQLTKLQEKTTRRAKAVLE
jgi:hypothetical protein